MWVCEACAHTAIRMNAHTHTPAAHELAHTYAHKVLAVLLTAMMHDVGHDGLNNTYHKNALTTRARTFNDQSIQENFHLRMVPEICGRCCCSIYVPAHVFVHLPTCLPIQAHVR